MMLPYDVRSIAAITTKIAKTAYGWSGHLPRPGNATYGKHPVSNAESTPWEDYQRWAPYEGGFATGGAIARRLRWSSMPPPATGRDGGRTKFPCVDAIGDRIGRG